MNLNFPDGLSETCLGPHSAVVSNVDAKCEKALRGLFVGGDDGGLPRFADVHFVMEKFASDQIPTGGLVQNSVVLKPVEGIETRGEPMWKPIGDMRNVPSDRDVKLAHEDCGEMHALVFPCRRWGSAWVDASTGSYVDVRPSHWGEWESQG